MEVAYGGHELLKTFLRLSIHYSADFESRLFSPGNDFNLSSSSVETNSIFSCSVVACSFVFFYNFVFIDFIYLFLLLFVCFSFFLMWKVIIPLLML